MHYERTTEFRSDIEPGFSIERWKEADKIAKKIIADMKYTPPDDSWDRDKFFMNKVGSGAALITPNG